MVEDWNVAKSHSYIDMEILTSFFSSYLADVSSILQFVAWNIDGPDECLELKNICQLNATYFVYLSGVICTAYRTAIRAYSITKPVTVKSFNFEFDALMTSHPSNYDEYKV